MDHLFRALPALLKEFDDSDGAVREAVIFAAWRRIAGELLCEHTAPFELADKRLIVAVVNNMWKRHLEELSGQMLFQLNSALGAASVTYIEFRIDEAFVKKNCVPGRNRKKVQANADPGANDAITAELLLRSEDIRDELLRRTFLSAAASCIEREVRMRSSEDRN